MSKFITAVSMSCTQEQYERDLRKPLLEMGYEGSQFDRFENFPILVNNLGKVLGRVSNVEIESKEECGRYFIDHYNPELYLALAAMTNEPFGIVGEWWTCIKDVTMNGVGEVKYNQGKLYKCSRNDCITDNSGDIYHCWPSWPTKTKRFKHFRKATKEEIINHLTKNKMEKKDLRELLQSGRTVELRNRDIGIIIQTHKGLLIQARNNWIDCKKYDADLEHTTNQGCGIIRVREIAYEYQILRADLEDAHIIWERKDSKEYTLDEVLKMAGLNKAEVKVVG